MRRWHWTRMRAVQDQRKRDRTGQKVRVVEGLSAWSGWHSHVPSSGDCLPSHFRAHWQPPLKCHPFPELQKSAP